MIAMIIIIIIIIIAVGVDSLTLVEFVRIIVVVPVLVHIHIGIHSHRIFTSRDINACIRVGSTATLVTASYSRTRWILVDVTVLI